MMDEAKLLSRYPAAIIVGYQLWRKRDTNNLIAVINV
jgi:hypothetical protein